MRRSSGLGVVALFATMLVSPGAVAAGHGPNVDEFIALHDPATSVSSGDCDLKPESQLWICALRARAERDQIPGGGWKSSNAYRQRVEIALPERMLRRLCTCVGKQRLRIADRTFFNRASIAQPHSGKLKTLSAVEYERPRTLYRRHQEQNVMSLRAVERHSETIRRRDIGFESA